MYRVVSDKQLILLAYLIDHNNPPLCLSVHCIKLLKCIFSLYVTSMLVTIPIERILNKEQSCIKKIENPAITQSSNTVYALKRILRVVERTESSDPVQVFVLFFFILEAYS